MEYTIAEFLEMVAEEFEPVSVGIQQNEVKHIPEINRDWTQIGGARETQWKTVAVYGGAHN
jgi:hypothetical protein